jgi:gamma-glutamylaminecyclotransferase
MEKEKREPSDIIMSTSTHLVFVYGTLRRRQWNHQLLHSSKFLGMAKTKKYYALYGNGVPFLSLTRPIVQVTGEIYSVDNATLSRLDELEGHPDAYKREQAEVVFQDGTDLSAWIYFHDEAHGDLIESGDFLKKTSPRRRKHNV